ncbi:MAG: lysine biosynthesis protein LysW [Planctomycetota bacterium]
MTTSTTTNTTTETITAICPECGGVVTFARQPLNGEIATCPHCAAELEVVSTAPLTLALAPEVEEDWGE